MKNPIDPLRRFSRIALGSFSVLSLWFGSVIAEESDEKPKAKVSARAAENLPQTIDEARGRARWLHETVHGALQVMHRDFFGDGDDESLSLPSQSLDDVFAEMARSWDVEIRWLGVNATKGVNHEPKDRFEEAAAKALEEGALEHEKIEEGRYRFVGVIHIKNECLKCHDRNRTSLEEKVAGLAISFPLQSKTPLQALAAAKEKE